MIQISNLQYSFRSGNALTYPDWKVPDGEHGLILGSSGSGKTTLLHLMGGFLRSTSGSVAIDDVEIEKLTDKEMDQFRGTNIGFVFQQPHLVASLSVQDNIRLASFLGRKDQSDSKIKAILESLGIADLAERSIHEISQGQAQRVAIARAVINDPKVIFGDEPTASLDDTSCQQVIALLQGQAAKSGATLILATHDQRVKAHFSNQLTL